MSRNSFSNLNKRYNICAQIIKFKLKFGGRASFALKPRDDELLKKDVATNQPEVAVTLNKAEKPWRPKRAERFDPNATKTQDEIKLDVNILFEIKIKKSRCNNQLVKTWDF